jgi:hypothetical protein
MKLTEKMKKNLAILGGVLIGIGLIAAIGMQFGSKPSGKDVLPGTGETETELIVDPGDFEKKEEESKVVSRAKNSPNKNNKPSIATSCIQWDGSISLQSQRI